MDKQDKELMKVLKGMSEEDRELTLKLIENLLELDEDARIRTFRYALYLKYMEFSLLLWFKEGV